MHCLSLFMHCSRDPQLFYSEKILKISPMVVFIMGLTNPLLKDEAIENDEVILTDEDTNYH